MNFTLRHASLRRLALLNWIMTATLLPFLAMADAVRAQQTMGTNIGPGNYRNVAFSSELGVQVEVSSHSFRNGAMKDQGSACPLNRPFISGSPDSRCWISSEYEHLPQWVWLHFPSLRRIDKVVIYASSLATSPVEFSGQYLPEGSDKFDTLFHVQRAQFDAQTLACTVAFKPVVASNFRLVIARSTASETPQSWVAELAQVEVYGVNATNGTETTPHAARRTRVCNPPNLCPKSGIWAKSWKSAPRGIAWCWRSRTRE